MRAHLLCLALLGVGIKRTPGVTGQNASERARAVAFLESQNAESERVYYTSEETAWTYYTNLTEDNRKAMVATNLEEAAFTKQSAKNASMFEWWNYQNATLQRMFASIADIGTAAMPDETKLERLNNVLSEMEEIYSTGKVCVKEDQCLELEPGITRLMATSRDYWELTKTWRGWREQTGNKMKDLYAEFVVLSNEAIRANGYNDTGAYWQSWYESDTFAQDVEKLFLQLEPLYIQLHAYTRRKLKEVYGEQIFPKEGHIPAQLLGNMWAQSWGNLLDILQPFKDKESVDVTPQMKAQNYTALRMFHTADDFFQSLGMKPMPQPFWDLSMIEKPKDGRPVVCHASAWDFYNGRDFRVKQCTDITMQDLITTHHEMGHIEYFLQYMHQPVVFRAGANPGFHEAVGDVMALSVATPKHLQSIGLLSNVEEDRESDINYMLSMALDKIAFLPFGYLMDLWRWSVFSGETPQSFYNTKWWALRCRYQGVSPPVERSEDDFDPGAKYHIPANTPYIRYFVSFVIQFQFHKALCQAANQTGPMHKCDIYRSREAGSLLSRVLELGSSRPWPEVMQIITGQDKMDAGPLMEYFQPLIDWLKTQNEGHETGWKHMCPEKIPMPSSTSPVSISLMALLASLLLSSLSTCGRTLGDMRTHLCLALFSAVTVLLTSGQLITDLDQARQFLNEQDAESARVYYKSSVMAWEYYTNITEENRNAMVASDLMMAEFTKESGRNASMFDWKNFQDETMRRRFSILADIGTAAMPDKTKLKRLKDVLSEMEEIYSKGKVCMKDDECLDLEPGLTRLMSSSRNYGELTKVWKGWRDQTGKKMKNLFAEFVSLSNEAIRANGYADTGAWWRSWYETETFRGDLEQLFLQLEPLYIQLHAYTRRKLMEVYGESVFPSGGHIPAHLLGNMWAQTWGNILSILQPYNKQSVDVTPQMKAKGFTPRMMFETSEEFFTSLGMEPMSQLFWKNSMIEKPKDGRSVVCHASAWDFTNGSDFRIKQCTDVTMEDLITVHHEMGHIQYYQQYMHQPVVFRSGANPGFHEAVGDVLALSVATPKHLQKLGLLTNVEEDAESDINYMLSMALDKIAFLPFGYLMDQWRWSVFSGETPQSLYNTKWWALRCRYQGISPPVERSENDFDPGAKYHIPANVPYIRYFVSFVIQFQFHKSLCQAANQTGPLHKCDIYQSKEAGKLLSRVLELGKSRPWPEAMQILTGQNKMDARPLMEYFQPLIDWLKDQNKGYRTGWDHMCPNSIPITASATSTRLTYGLLLVTIVTAVLS
ncbi:angiotensin-converting enzyme-like [Haliotis cracherodii]|uniref:angiotensin-converting enzyme-like n=1 Tax=Haliotis cracherodii TaxID=6455 RepID=UPI0039EC4C7F